MAGLTLSVLVCHVPERSAQLERMLVGLGTHERAEILVDGEQYASIGAKRNALLARAAGAYVCYVDDDDVVDDNYLVELVGACERSRPDCVGIVGVILHGYQCPRKFVHSITCAGWYTNTGDLAYYRTPNHLNPIRVDIVREVGGFNPRSSFGEDIEFSRIVRPYLKREVLVRKPLYYYLCMRPAFEMKDGEE